MKCINCGKTIRVEENFELTQYGNYYCETCWTNFDKDERYYRRHKGKVAIKNKKYHEETKDIYNPIRRENAREYWIKNRDEILAKRKHRRKHYGK